MLDWDGLQKALQTALLDAVSAGGPWRAAALGELYAETDGLINAPLLYLNTDGKDMKLTVRLGDLLRRLGTRGLDRGADNGGLLRNGRALGGYFRPLPGCAARICVAVGARLGIPVFYVEHSRYEEMLARCLTPSHLGSLFPEVVARQAERARVSALPPSEQIAYYVSRLDRFGGPTGAELFNLRSVFIMTMRLLLSSYTCGLHMLSAEQGELQRFAVFAVLTFLPGAAFLALELSEFADMVRKGAGPSRSAFLSAFFTLVGMHGTHVATGLLWLLYMSAQVAVKGLRPAVLRRLLCFSLFWHALDIVWVGVMTLVYLMGVQR